jgi:holo-[acyl-carrier protein] synthase
VRVGIDLLEIERLEAALQRWPRLAERLFTDGEREYAASRARPGQHLAARFCAKEAVAKALGMKGWNFRDVEVLGGDGPPELRLHGEAAELARAQGVELAISLTHTRRDAAAVVVVS